MAGEPTDAPLDIGLEPELPLELGLALELELELTVELEPEPELELEPLEPPHAETTRTTGTMTSSSNPRCRRIRTFL
jgi:hypothetical protein